MDILIFDIRGFFAHFRKYYTNSSSLTYTVPPRTTIAGLIGAILGKERDSYYDIFNSDRMKIAIRKMTETRKIVQTLNYIKAETINKLLSPTCHTQVPFEVLCSGKEVVYRVYIHHEDNKIMNELEHRIRMKKYAYVPYLGVAPFNCSIEYIAREKASSTNQENVNICTVVDSNKIDEFIFDSNKIDLLLMKEKMPCDFNEKRVVTRIKSYIYDDKCAPLTLKLNSESFAIKYNDKTDNIVFM